MQYLIATKADHERPSLFKDLPQLLYFSKKSPVGDSYNEDALGIFVVEDGYVLAIADGAGGYPKGEEAAEKILMNLKNCFESKNFNISNLRSHIVDTIDETNRELLSSGVGARTTLTIVEVVKNKARCYQVGDSTALICGQKGKLKYRSTAHSPVGYGIEAGLIDEEEALSHPDLHFISNLLGEARMKIEIGPEVELNPNDSIFIASDGIFDNFSTDMVVELIRKGDIEEISRSILTDIEKNIYGKEDSKKDDISFILFKNDF